MFKATNAYKYGPSIGDRALKALAFNGELEINGEETQVRRLK